MSAEWIELGAALLGGGTLTAIAGAIAAKAKARGDVDKARLQSGAEALPQVLGRLVRVEERLDNCEAKHAAAQRSHDDCERRVDGLAAVLTQRDEDVSRLAVRLQETSFEIDRLRKGRGGGRAERVDKSTMEIELNEIATRRNSTPPQGMRPPPLPPPTPRGNRR